MNSHLRREQAPIAAAAWQAIDDEAQRTLRHFLAGRPLVDVDGPHGWRHGAVDLGRAEPLPSSPGVGVEGRVRQVQPVVELRTPFRLGRAELDAAERGADDPDLQPLVDAARRAAEAEDRVVFLGYRDGGITGSAEASPYPALPITDDYGEYPRLAARAVAELRRAAVGGPYGIALGPRCYTGVVETTEHGGYPVLQHLHTILGGPVIWAPAVDGAVVVSLRGGDYRFSAGQDCAVGYAGHDDDAVDLYLEESFTFRVVDERAALALHHTS